MPPSETGHLRGSAHRTVEVAIDLAATIAGSCLAVQFLDPLAGGDRALDAAVAFALPLLVVVRLSLTVLKPNPIAWDVARAGRLVATALRSLAGTAAFALVVGYAAEPPFPFAFYGVELATTAGLMMLGREVAAAITRLTRSIRPERTAAGA